MDNKNINLIDEYNKYFITYINNYSSAERQAEQFKIVSALKNVSTTETVNSVTEPQKSEG